MRRGKWANFWGGVCGAVTLGVLARGVNHVQKKFGVKHVSHLIDYRRIGEYALDKFILGNEKFYGPLLDKFGGKERMS